MEQILEFVRHNDGTWVLVVLFLAAALEYMIPPLPGDTIVLMGSLPVAAGTRSFASVYTAVVIGGFFGTLMHFLLGRWLALPNGSVRGQAFIERLTGRGSFDRFLDRLRRYGLWVIAINRAFPGIRSVTFIAAGAAKLPIHKVMALGLVSNAAWSMAVLLLGTTLGGNWEKIQETFGVYSGVAAWITGILVFVYLLIWVVRRTLRAKR